MIFSNFQSHDSVTQYPLAIQKALHYLQENDFSEMKTGIYEVDNNISAKVFDLTSKSIEETSPEVHKKYIDVHYWVSGEETIGFTPNKADYIVKEAIKEQDIYFYESVDNESFLSAKKGDYVIFFPNDVHRPGIANGTPISYRKVVLKVSIELL